MKGRKFSCETLVHSRRVQIILALWLRSDFSKLTARSLAAQVNFGDKHVFDMYFASSSTADQILECEEGSLLTAHRDDSSNQSGVLGLAQGDEQLWGVENHGVNTCIEDTWSRKTHPL